MNFITKLSLRLFFWAFIFGFISGIFGISLALIQITNFYIQEGTQQSSDTYVYRINNSEKKMLTDEALTELQNIEGIAFVDPYFSPTNNFIGSINYFGFTASYPVQVQGVPKRLGQQKAYVSYKGDWDSADLESIPILLPQQAISLYNNLAPQRSWPTLSQDSFLGLPGIRLSIELDNIPTPIENTDTLSTDQLSSNNTTNITSVNTEESGNIFPVTDTPNIQEQPQIPPVKEEEKTNNTLPNKHSLKVIISGFDKDQFGTTATVSAQKLFAIFKFLGKNPTYDYVNIETISGLSRPQVRESTKQIQELGFELSSKREENIQQGIFVRVKYTILIFALSILTAFIFLLYYNVKSTLGPIKQKILLYRMWAVKEYTFHTITFITVIFSCMTGIVSWIICFFAVIPAQQYISNTLKNIGINVPSLRESAKISIETAIISSTLYFSIIIGTLIIFYIKNRKKTSIKF